VERGRGEGGEGGTTGGGRVAEGGRVDCGEEWRCPRGECGIGCGRLGG
jgi:hypothetical protein